MMRNIFLSSTFRDMQSERDVIRNKVFPDINRKASLYNDSVTFNDLRWGIDTSGLSEGEASKKIFRACNNALMVSDQLMIILLGNRYGWIPGSAELESLIEDNIIERALDPVSATEFEIEQGVFRGEKRALVYIREFTNENPLEIPEEYRSEGDESWAKLEQLKDKLRNNQKCKVHTYSVCCSNGKIEPKDLDKFAAQIIKDLECEFAEEWEQFSALSKTDREQLIQWEYIKKRAEGFHAREETLKQIVNVLETRKIKEEVAERILETSDNMYFIVGEDGSGKSTIISKLACAMQEKNWNVLPFIGGLTPESSDSILVLEQIVSYLKEHMSVNGEGSNGSEITNKYNAKLDKNKSNTESKEKSYCKMLQVKLISLASKFVREHGDLLIIIDGLDQFYPDENRSKRVFCPSGIDAGVKFVISCTPEISQREKNTFILDRLNTHDKKLIIRGTENRIGKELSRDVVFCILGKEGTHNPLFTSLIIERLLLMDQDDFRVIYEAGGKINHISKRQIDIIQSLPENVFGIAENLFDAVGNRIGPSFVKEALNYLAVARKGLRVSDLSYCMGERWDAELFLRLRYFLADQFQMHSDGRVDFIHKSLRRGVLKSLDERELYQLNLKLIWCFHECDVTDPVRNQELLYHSCYVGTEYNYAASVIWHAVNPKSDISERINVCSALAKSVVNLAVIDRGKWIRKWMSSLLELAKGMQNDRQKNTIVGWEKPYGLMLFITDYVFEMLPQTPAGYETGYSLARYMNRNVEKIEEMWDISVTTTLKIAINRYKTKFSSKIGKTEEQVIWAWNEFEESREHYKSLKRVDYSGWREVFLRCYNVLATSKGSKDENVLIEALDAASYGLEMLESKEYLDKILDDFSMHALIPGAFYGCLGEIAGRLGDYEAERWAYEQDFLLREEGNKRINNLMAYYCFSGSYHNLFEAYYALVIRDISSYNFSETGYLLRWTKYPLRRREYIRFGKERKTKGEELLERFHKFNPMLSSLIALDYSLDITEYTRENSREVREQFGGDGSYDLMIRLKDYTFYPIVYFEAKREFEMEMHSDTFAEDKTKKAIRRLIKSIGMEINIFANYTSSSIAERIGGKFGVLWKYRRYITEDTLCDDVIGKLNDYINTAVMILKVLNGTVEEMNSEWSRTEEDYSRLVLVFMCYYSSKLALERAKSVRVFNIAKTWCEIALSYISCLSMWMQPSGIIASIIRINSSNISKDDQSEMDIDSIQKELVSVQNRIRIHCASGNSSGGDDIIPQIIAQPKEEATIEAREGYAEVSFLNGGNYKGEWKNGKPNGYGIKTNYLGEILCGVFEDGELRKKLPKILVSLKLKRYV